MTAEFIPDDVGELYRRAGVGGNAAIDEQKTLKEWSEDLARLPLIAQPGTEWHYSVGMDVLGRLIEVISGQSFRDFLRSRIFNPLGMEDTDFYVPTVESPHARVRDWLERA